MRLSVCVLLYPPTNTIGVRGQWWVISGHHFDFTLHMELRWTRKKQITNTSVSGYERGRTRSYESCPAVSHSDRLITLPSIMRLAV